MNTKPNFTPNIGNNSNKVKSPEDLRLENLARRKREIGQMVMSQLMDQVAGRLPVGAQDLQENEDFRKLCKKYENDVRHEGETTDLNKITNLLNIDADGIQTIKDFIDMAEKGLEESEGREYFQEAQHSTKAIIESIKMTGSARVVGPDGKLYDMNLVALDGDSDAYKDRVTDLETIGDNLDKGDDHSGIYDANLVSGLTLHGSYFAQSNIAELEEYLDAASTEVDSYPDEDGAYSFKRTDNGESAVAQYNYTYTPKDVNQAAESSVYPATLLYSFHKNQLWENALIENEQNSDAGETAVSNVNGSGAKETDPTSGSGSKVVVEIVAASDPNSGETGKANNTEAAAQKAGEAASKLSGTIETVNDHKSELDNMISEYNATGNLLLPSWTPKEVWSKTLLGMIFGRSNGIIKGKFVPAFIQLNDEYKLGLSSKDIKDLASRAGSVSAKESSNKEKTFEIERSVKDAAAGGVSLEKLGSGEYSHFETDFSAMSDGEFEQIGIGGDNIGRAKGAHSAMFVVADGIGHDSKAADASRLAAKAFLENGCTNIEGVSSIEEAASLAKEEMKKRIVRGRERLNLCESSGEYDDQFEEYYAKGAWRTGNKDIDSKRTKDSVKRDWYYQLGSTVVAAEVIGDRLVYASVGDSSIFIVRDNQIILVAGERGGHGREISNSIGAGEEAKYNGVPDDLEIDLMKDGLDKLSRQEQAGDRVAASKVKKYGKYDAVGVRLLRKGDTILLVSDGVTGDTIAQTLSDEEYVNAAGDGNPKINVERLLGLAKKSDDQSVIAIKFEG